MASWSLTDWSLDDWSLNELVEYQPAPACRVVSVGSERRTLVVAADGPHVAPSDIYLLADDGTPLQTDDGQPLEIDWTYRSRRLVVAAERRTLEVPC